MRVETLSGFILMTLLILLSSEGLLANVPSEYTFTDPVGDSVFYQFDGNTDVPNPIADEIFSDIVSVGYSLDRTQGELTFILEFPDIPVLNNSAFYTMSIEFENGLNKIAIRTFYGEIGLEIVNEEAILDLFVLLDGSADTEMANIAITNDENTIRWTFTPTIDIVSIFDNPNLPMSRVTAEMEYSINGSSLLSEPGDYYSDEFVKTEFEFAGGVQGNDQGGGFFDLVDPIALSLYFGIPLIVGSARLIRRIKL